MARTARPGVLIRNNGTDVAFASVIDLTGTVSGTDQGNGVIGINGTGGAGGGMTKYAITSGTIDDTNKVFGFSTKPLVIVVNGSTYEENHGWAWSAPNATLDFAVGTNGDIYGLA